jgi:hypothetical protein
MCTLYIENVLEQGAEESMFGQKKEKILDNGFICINGSFVIVTLYQMWLKYNVMI